MPNMGGFFLRRDVWCWEQSKGCGAPRCPWPWPVAEGTAPTADRDLPQAPPHLSQPWFSDLISSGSTPVNLPNPFLNPFILLALQKVAPPSLLQAAHTKLMDYFEQRLFSASDCHVVFLWIFASSVLWFLGGATGTISNTQTLGAQK